VDGCGWCINVSMMVVVICTRSDEGGYGTVNCLLLLLLYLNIP